MNGFTYSIQTETVSRRRESRSRGICLSKVCIKRGMELSVNPVSKNCYGAADSYKLSFPVLPQVLTYFRKSTCTGMLPCRNGSGRH